MPKAIQVDEEARRMPKTWNGSPWLYDMAIVLASTTRCNTLLSSQNLDEPPNMSLLHLVVASLWLKN